jgi:hypothetical protein
MAAVARGDGAGPKYWEMGLPLLLLTTLLLAAATSLPTAAAPSATPAPEPLGPSVRTPPPPPPPPSRDGGADRVDEEVMGKLDVLLRGEAAYIDHEEEGLRHARAMAQLPAEERRKRELEFVRASAAGRVARDHGGDTHKLFDELDSSEDEHLSDYELLGLMGDDPNNHTGLGVFSKIRQQMADGVKHHMDTDKDGKVHRSEFLAVLQHDL